MREVREVGWEVREVGWERGSINLPRGRPRYSVAVLSRHFIRPWMSRLSLTRTSEHTEQENDTPEPLLGWTVSYLIRRMWLSGFQLLLATRTELKILRVCRKDNHTHTHS